jgi:hypothetical protein
MAWAPVPGPCVSTITRASRGLKADQLEVKIIGKRGSQIWECPN